MTFIPLINNTMYIVSLTSRSPIAEARLSALPPASSSSGLILVRRFDISLARISLILSIVSPLSNGLKYIFDS